MAWLGLGLGVAWPGFGIEKPRILRLFMARMGAQPGHAIPSQATPNPGQATPYPSQAMPKPGQATANSGQAMPKPGQATPKPRPSHAKPRPGFAPGFPPGFPPRFCSRIFPGFSPPLIWWIWHPKNEIWSPFGHIQRSPSENRRSGNHSVRRTQPWWPQALGTPLFLGKQGYVGPCSKKILAPFSRVGVGKTFGLAKNETRSRFPERFPTLLGLACPMT